MKWFRCVLWFLAGTAVISACQSNAPADGPRPFPRADTWIGIMSKVVGPGYEDVIEREADRGADMDFAAIVRAADECAVHMALGYGKHEQKSVAKFGQFARESEAWFREVSAAATARDAASVQGLVDGASEMHCDRCHDAASNW